MISNVDISVLICIPEGRLMLNRNEFSGLTATKQLWSPPFIDSQSFDDLDQLNDPLSPLDVAMNSVRSGWTADNADSGRYATVVQSVFEEAVPGIISLVGIHFPVLSVLGGMMHGVLSNLWP